MPDPYGDGVRPVEVCIHIRPRFLGRCQTCKAYPEWVREVALGQVAADLCVACLKTLAALAGKEAEHE